MALLNLKYDQKNTHLIVNKNNRFEYYLMLASFIKI